VALVSFTVGAVICGAAEDMAVLLLGRCIQGVGAGGITTLTEIIVTDLVPLRDRGKWFSIIGAAVAVGTSAGPVIGGSLAEKVSWVSNVVRSR
jgi:MFS family permease